jgi:hypothetical protein
MHDVLYVIIVHKLSNRGDTKKTTEHPHSLIGSSALLIKLTPVIFELFSCVVECIGEEQCKWLSNDAMLLKGF